VGGVVVVVASYPLSSQAPTPVEVELGCDNNRIRTDMDHDKDKFENYEETETYIRNDNVSVRESSPDIQERSTSPPSLSSSVKVLPPLTKMIQVFRDIFLLALEYL
jgi:hypothetical protein